MRFFLRHSHSWQPLLGCTILILQIESVLEVHVNLRPSSRQGLPLHFDIIDRSARTGNSQTFSFALHAAILGALLLLAAAPKTVPPIIKYIDINSHGNIPAYVPPIDPTQMGAPSHGSKGGGGENDPRPATFGRLAPGSSMPLVPPRKILESDSQMPEPPAVFDPNAPAAVPVVTDLGLPWMKEKNDSAGPGRNHGFGTGDKGGMGDQSGSGAGEADDGAPYANVATPVVCLYCPEPPYTEEARKNKLQGKMLLQVFVGEDGKAKRVRIVRPLGMGLDESAEQAVYSWRFSPARDAAKHPVASWVTIETRFQLF